MGNGCARIGIVGAGRMGRLHGANIARLVKGAELFGAADIEPGRARALARNLGTRAFPSYEAMLAERSLDAVCICTPLGGHKDSILQAIRAGKHVFTEKPLTLRPRDADLLVAAVERSGLVGAIGYMRRYDEEFELAKGKLDAGAIGTVAMIRTTSRDWGMPPIPGFGADPRASGDIAFELSTHCFDSLRWMLGCNIVEVHAWAATLTTGHLAKKAGCEIMKDTIVANVRFENGVLGSVEGCLNTSYGYDGRMEIVGEKGMLAIGTVSGARLAMAGPDKSVTSPVPFSFPERFREAYVKEMADFVRCIREGGVPRATIADGAAAVKVCHAVNESIRKNRPVRVKY